MKKILKYVASAVALCAAIAMCGCGPSKPVLNVYMWSDYIDLDLVKEFEQKYDCKVVIDIFDSNEFMYSKLKAGGAGYDLIQPSSYMAKIMYEQKMIEKLDHSKLPSLAKINRAYLDNLAIDKKMEYSVPYMIGFTCIAYNKDKLGKIPDTWAVFGDSKLKGRMTMLNDMRETIGAALLFKGHSINTTDEKQLEEAKKQIIEWKRNLAKFDNEVYKVGIRSGEFQIVQGYSGDLFQVFAEAPELAWMCPKEGFTMCCDDWAIPVTARNKELAYKFIDFVMTPQNAARNIEFTCFSCPVDGAKEFVSEENRNHPGMFIADEMYKKGEIIQDLGADNAKYIKIWDEIKLAK
ncbi:MAG: spermidine/putrescine ABC transporter substrate-binding protein [Opitutales bacterium]|nr:spermidine/putrescine ABC transporter substrate-binding protein [Opitutales bacterium]